MNLRKHLPAHILTVFMILLVCAPLTSCNIREKTSDTTGKAGLGAPASAKAESAEVSTINQLAGTKWQMLYFQSMSDDVGTTSSKDPSKFTMDLNKDGTVVMNLDCNQVKGTWSAETSGDHASGRFEFGKLVSTRAKCPPPDLGNKFMRQAKFIRGYILKDGKLYLSLMADGGVFAWEPYKNEMSSKAKTHSLLEAAILKASPDYTQEIVDISKQEARYVYGQYDLNGDGREETFVYLLGSIFCGTGGCNLLLFKEGDDGTYTLINNLPTSRPPIIVSPQRNNGWNNIIRLESGGGAKPMYATYAFNGTNYVEQRRISKQSGVPEGTIVFTEKLTFNDGTPLEPHE